MIKKKVETKCVFFRFGASAARDLLSSYLFYYGTLETFCATDSMILIRLFHALLVNLEFSCSSSSSFSSCFLFMMTQKIHSCSIY